MDREQRVGGLLGLLVGDALGVPYEFHDPANLPPRERIEMDPPEGFRRSHLGTPAGTWSDDGAHALALLDTLLTEGGWDAPAFARRLIAWWHEGAFTPDGRAFDIGNQTTTALHRLERGMSADQAGPRGERDNGNGSLMRVLPLALWHTGDDLELVALSRAQSLVTHGHVRSQLCCAIDTLWARYLAAGDADPFGRAVSVVGGTLGRDERAELDLIVGFTALRGSGYVVDTLHVARDALAEPTFEGVVRRAIAWGLDTDTSACVAGGLAGVRDGVAGIPERWLAALQGRALVDALLERLTP
ncbi:MAG: ADP-ribosylglycohydrolase family protein [Alphaproteobacteria bacterium]|nr:ADP-ribosylglycohydrolase family protein [Alphaproteobacteria bacterium]MCB9696467.1 ADP-ribosylglycohydrolase family protein [Alphaproteobacteria bacterium]